MGVKSSKWEKLVLRTPCKSHKAYC